MADNIADVKHLLEEITQPDHSIPGCTAHLLVEAYSRINRMKQLAQDALDLLEVDRIEREAA